MTEEDIVTDVMDFCEGELAEKVEQEEGWEEAQIIASTNSYSNDDEEGEKQSVESGVPLPHQLDRSVNLEVSTSWR